MAMSTETEVTHRIEKCIHGTIAVSCSCEKCKITIVVDCPKECPNKGLSTLEIIAKALNQELIPGLPVVEDPKIVWAGRLTSGRS